MVILSRTPLRISLVGGGTDTPAFYEKSTGAVISMAIDKYVWVVVNTKFDGRLRVSYAKTENVDWIDDIKHDIVRNTLKHFNLRHGLEIVSVADIPGSGTGLGSSSAFTVGLIHAVNDQQELDYISTGILAELAFKIERQSHPDIGKQDHYAAAYGGFNFIRFHKTHVEIKPVEPPDMSWFLLLYTGLTRKADTLLRAQRDGFEADKIAIGKEMAKLAEEFDNNRIGELLKENWKLKTKLYAGVTNPEIDAWYEAGMNHGAQGGKLCGAGGGGFLLFHAPPDCHKRIEKATGLRHVPFKLDTEGSVISYG